MDGCLDNVDGFAVQGSHRGDYFLCHGFVGVKGLPEVNVLGDIFAGFCLPDEVVLQIAPSVIAQLSGKADNGTLADTTGIGQFSDTHARHFLAV